MSLPPVSHLQAVILDCCCNGTISGREIRSEMERRGFKQSRPSFYGLMTRLEDLGMVEGSFRNTTVAGQIVRERFYTIQASGVNAIQETRNFYSSKFIGGLAW